MNQTDFEAFVEVATRQSFSLAADALNVTQPAVTKRIQNLEHRFAVRLFDRLGSGIRLTEAGRTLLPQARELLADIANMQHSLHSVGRKPQGELHLATSHHVGLHRLDPVLRAYCRRYPEVRLAIRFEDSEAAHELVLAAEVELAVVTLDPAGEGTLSSQPIWQDPLAFVCAGDHPLARRGAVSISLDELAAHPCILPGLGTYTGRIAQSVFQQAGLELKPAMSTNYLETIGMLVGTGMGWSLLPRSMLRGDLQALDVPVALERALGSIVHPGRTLSAAANAFLAELGDYADAA